MKKNYKNFSEVLADYPQIYAVSVQKNYSFGFVLHVCTSADSFEEIGFNTYSKVWTELHLEQDAHWFYDVGQYEGVTALYFCVPDYTEVNGTKNGILDFYIDGKVDFCNLSHLSILHIEAPYTYFKYHLRFPAANNITELRLTGWKNLELLGDFPCVEKLTITHTSRLDLLETLRHFSPTTLQDLELSNIKHLVFFPDIEAKYKNKKTAHEAIDALAYEGLQNFTELTRLNLISCGLQKLPFSLSPFKKLESLEIARNTLIPFPYEICELSLENLDISRSAKVKEKIVKGGSELLKLFKDCDAKGLTEEDKRALLMILLEEHQYTAKIALPALLRYLSAFHNNQISQKILALCEGKITQNPLTSKTQHIAIIGKIPALSVGKLVDFFEKYQVKISKKYTDTAQVFCIGECPNPQDIQAILALPASTLCFPTHIKELMNRLETGYLVDSEVETIENLDNLLRNADKANRLLAFQMLESGGLPPLMFERLCLDLASDASEAKEELINLLKKYATPVQFLELQKMNKTRKEPFFLNRLRFLLKSPTLDSLRLTQAAWQFFIPISNDNQEDFANFLRYAFWETAGEAWEYHFQQSIDANGVLHLCAYHTGYYYYSPLPASIAGEARVTKLRLPPVFAQHGERKLLNSLPNLHELEVSYRKNGDENREAQEARVLAPYQKAFPNLQIRAVLVT